MHTIEAIACPDHYTKVYTIEAVIRGQAATDDFARYMAETGNTLLLVDFIEQLIRGEVADFDAFERAGVERLGALAAECMMWRSAFAALFAAPPTLALPKPDQKAAA